LELEHVKMMHCKANDGRTEEDPTSPIGPDETKAIHAKLLYHLCRDYPMVEREDISQELWAAYYALTGPELCDARGIERKMRAAGARYCRKEKANAEGYNIADEVFYGNAALKRLLVQWFATGPVDSPPVTYETSVSRPNGDGGAHGDYLVSLIDVEEALKGLKPAQREVLWYGFSPEYADRTDAEIAMLLASRGWRGMTAERFRAKVRWALGRLQRELGGPNPWPKRT
jgi:hypothetical protein